MPPKPKPYIINKKVKMPDFANNIKRWGKGEGISEILCTFADRFLHNML